jgi:D-glycero-D-manno-heptose 1,7-bisphosphate phosphatase
MSAWEVETAFVDRDGTINVDATEGGYIESWDELSFLPRAKEAIRLLNDLGLRVFVVTNQRGVALGRMSAETVEEIHRLMALELAGIGATVDGFYYCPHDYGECDCRKPDIGLFRKAQADFPDVDFSRSVMIGNTGIDMEAGRRAGSHRIFVGDETSDAGEVDLAVPSLWDAACALAERISPRPQARERAASTRLPRSPGALWDR